MKIFASIIISIVAAAIITGFFVVGSPGQERLRRFDERKIQDLGIIQSEVIYFWQNKSRLPDSLSELNDSVRRFSVPKDPQSGQGYEYHILAPNRFEFCAMFNLPDPRDDNSFWTHGAGHTCFQKTADAEPDKLRRPSG